MMMDLSYIYDSLFELASQTSTKGNRFEEQQSCRFQNNENVEIYEELDVSDSLIGQTQETEEYTTADSDSMALTCNYGYGNSRFETGEWFDNSEEHTFPSVGSLPVYKETSQNGKITQYDALKPSQFQFELDCTDEWESERGLFPGSNNASRFPIKSDVLVSFDHAPGKSCIVNLRSVAEIPEKYRSVFSDFPYFNIIQSRVFDEVIYTDKPVVISSPTGSGKTVIFELAIVRFLMQLGHSTGYKIVYMAPIKALCSERQADWKKKFNPLGLNCAEITGDSETDDYFELQKFSIIITTPEKWDSLTRRWQGANSLVKMVRIFMIDEIHLLNDDARGATLEAVITRMKTMEKLSHQTSKNENESNMRFIAVSATIPNIQDVAEWLSSGKSGCTYKMNDELRPVKLKRIVLGYPFHDGWTEFKFDISLTYKLSHVINTYSDRKPTLVFCSTRKGAIQTATILAKEAKFVYNAHHKQLLTKEANMLRDNKLRDAVLCGIGFHHAGLDSRDRRSIEQLFVKGVLPVLISTSTLAMGVNLPAHLVVIKSTTQYRAGCFEEYSEIQIVQMMGRAGRPQFDATAAVVIMTKQSLKLKYERFVSGTQIIESSLHKHLIEHLNAEIVLHTITDISIAMEWIRSTFMYIRVMKNPKHYGIVAGVRKEQVEKKLHEICLRNLNALAKYKIIIMDDDSFLLRPTDVGYLMTRYCTAFETMKQFSKVEGTESLSELIKLVSDCKEFEDIILRTSDKKTLNMLNKSKNTAIVRFPVSGKINTRQLKTNCLIQAIFGCLPVADVALNQDMSKIIRIGKRVTRCLADYLMIETRGYQALLNAVILAKCFHAHLWENSKRVCRQLDKIGVALSDLLLSAGITSFEAIEDVNPRELEMILNRNPPFGDYVHAAAARLPKYEIVVEQGNTHCKDVPDLSICVQLKNHRFLQESPPTLPNHSCILIVGNNNNQVLLKQRISDTALIKTGRWTRRIQVCQEELNINLISEYYVGLDKQNVYVPCCSRDVERRIKTGILQGTKRRQTVENQRWAAKNGTIEPPDIFYGNITSCRHQCSDKILCGHNCCKPNGNAQNWKNINISFRSEANSSLKMPISKRLKIAQTPSLLKKENNNMSPFVSNTMKTTENYPYFNDMSFDHKSFNEDSEIDQFDYHETSASDRPCKALSEEPTVHADDLASINTLDPNPADPFFNKVNSDSFMEEEDNFFQGCLEDKTLNHTQGKVIAWKVNKSTQNHVQNQSRLMNSRKRVQNAEKENQINIVKNSDKDSLHTANKKDLRKIQWVPPDHITQEEDLKIAEAIFQKIMDTMV